MGQMSAQMAIGSGDDGTCVASTCFTQDEVAAYAALTCDFNPLHTDPEFAATTRFGAPIVFGTQVLGLVWASIEATFGAGALEGARASIRFLRPVQVGSGIIVRAYVDGAGDEASQAGRGQSYRFTLTSQAGDLACEVEVWRAAAADANGVRP